MRLVFRVRVVAGCLRERLCHNVLLDPEGVVLDLTRDLTEKRLDVGYDLLPRLTRENEVEDLGAGFTRERTPVAAYKVQALRFSR